ncbi:CAP domain-containing protein [uncultured Thiodictyon sp.]|uniref:CAP domain-containing protein n=1 Tax=uncultured Thiodictyon sp. TaxID=1846217 RepID=UPI0025DFD258|nr:CAP domain-containing protein [uncultured Thiodictyon sp.]
MTYPIVTSVPGRRAAHRLRPRLAAALCLALAMPPLALQAEAVPRDAMLAAHNRVRAEVGVAPLQWSAALAGSAQEWADTLATRNGCAMKHSAGPLGENLYWASPLRFSDGRQQPQSIEPEKVAGSWAGERRFYRPATNDCAAGQVCGHYTQMVWRATTQVGCAYRVCANDEQVWVCQYRPAGNIIGRPPY